MVLFLTDFLPLPRDICESDKAVKSFTQQNQPNFFYFNLVNDNNIQDEVEAKNIKKEYPRQQSKNMFFYVAELSKFVFFRFHLVNDNDNNNQDEVETKRTKKRKVVSLVLIMLLVL